MMSLREQLLRGGVSSVFVKLSNIMLQFAVTTALARACGTYNFGVYSYVFAVVQILSILAQLGLQVMAVREVAAYQATGRWGLLRGFIRQANLLVLAVSALLVAGALAGGWVFADRFLPAQVKTFAWGLALFPLIALGNLRGAILRGFHRIVQGQLPEFVLRPGIFLLLVLSFWSWADGRELAPEWAMALHAGAGLAAFACGAIMLNRHLPRELRDVAREYDSRRWLRSAVVLSLMTSMQIINSQTDIVMLGMLAGAREAGIYRVAVQCALLVIFGLAVVNMVVAPYFGAAYARQDMARLRSLTRVCARVAAACALPVFLVCYFAGDRVLGAVFGPEFAAGHASLRILAAGQLFGTAMGSVVILLSMTGHERSLTRGLAVTAVLNIGLNLLLIPRWGMEGAATATAVSMLCWNLLLVRAAKVKLGIASWVFAR